MRAVTLLRRTLVLHALAFSMLFILSIFSTSVQAKAFEGSISMELKSESLSEVKKLSYYVRPGWLRIEIIPSNGSEKGHFIGILDYKNKKQFFVLPETKKYREVQWRDKGLLVPLLDSLARVKTGRSEKILGYDCEEWSLEWLENGDTLKTTFWFSDKFPILDEIKYRIPLFKFRSKDEGLLPFRAKLSSEKIGDVFTLEVKAIEEKKLKEALFIPPAGYEKEVLAEQ